MESMARYYGLLGGVTYGEPFRGEGVGLVEDVTAIPVKSIERVGMMGQEKRSVEKGGRTAAVVTISIVGELLELSASVA